MRDVLLTVVFFGSLVPVIGRPWIGVLICAWIGYMNPHRLTYGFAYDFPFFAIAAGITIVGVVVTAGRERAPLTRETIVLLLFVLWMNVTVQFALNPHDVWAAWQQVMTTQLMLFVALIAMSNPRRLNWFVWVIVASVGFYGVKGGLFALATGGNNRVFGPPDSYLEDNNALALALVTILPLMRYLQLKAERLALRLGLVAMMILTALAVLTSYSRAGFLALITVGILLWLKSPNKLKLGAVMLATTPLLFMYMPGKWFQRMQTIQTYQEDESAQGRMNAWRFAYNLASDRPLLGGGFRVFTPALFSIYAPDPNNYHESHSIYFEVLAEQGFPGLILFLTLGVLTWRSATWVNRHACGLSEWKWAGDLAGMAQIGLGGFAVGGAFAGLAYFDLPYHMMAIIVLAKMMLREATDLPAAAQVGLEPAS